MTSCDLTCTGNLVYDRIRRKSTIIDPVTNKPVMLPGV